MTTSGAPVDVMVGFAEYFDDLDDPRLETKIHHPLLSVLMIAVLGVLCGAEGWADLAIFAKAKHPFLATFLDLPHGPPRKDTFRRVFEALEPNAFRGCFLRWIGDLVGSLAGKQVAVDGKTLRAALAHRDALPLHLVHAWVVDNGALFAQVAGWGKGQELGALPDLLRLLDVRGATVTIDALGCQREIAAQVVEQGGDYILTVKDNQPLLHEAVEQHLLTARQEAAPNVTYARTEEHGHGRHEVREAWVVNDLTGCELAQKWPGAKSIVLLERTRTRGDDAEQSRHCYIASDAILDAATALTRIRRHWSVENHLHWSLDVAFREDQSRIREEHGAQNFALIRRLALNALKRDKSLKHGIRAKQKNCGWDNEYLLSILHLMEPPKSEGATPLD